MNNKESYAGAVSRFYIPIFSQPWWLDAICGEDNWDVWLCRRGEQIVAAMPYYLESRKGYRYVTKAPLTQNNGILFAHESNSTALSRQKAEEKIINEACDFIRSLNVDVYEQQYHHSFQNWSPFYWNGYEAIPRYTYLIEDTSDMESVWKGISAKQRSVIKKGQRSVQEIRELDPEVFYAIHAQVFERQGLSCPFSEELWARLWSATHDRGVGIALGAFTTKKDIASFAFFVQDDKSFYQLLGGSTPALQRLDTYDALIWHGIQLAHEAGRSYDFEGSMIKRIARSFREYGGTPKEYYRIRKVFNPEILIEEARHKCEMLV